MFGNGERWMGRDENGGGWKIRDGERGRLEN